MADSALRSSRRMRRLVGDLLLLARADAGREAPRGAGRPRRRGRARPPPRRARCRPSTRSRWTCPGRGPDRGRRRRPAPPGRNLVENALLHTPAGHAGDRVRCASEADAAVLEVADRGPGVPPARASACSSASPAARATAPPAAAAGWGWRSCRAVADAHGGTRRAARRRGRRRALRGHAAGRPAGPVRSDPAATVLAPREA